MEEEEVLQAHETCWCLVTTEVANIASAGVTESLESQPLRALVPHLLDPVLLQQSNAQAYK